MEDLRRHTSNFLKVLSDPTRLNILEYLKNDSCTSLEIQKKMNISQSYASHQLKKLYDAGLIVYEKKGKKKIYKPKNRSIFKLITIIQSYILKLEKEKINKLSSINQLEPVKDFSDIF